LKEYADSDIKSGAKYQIFIKGNRDYFRVFMKRFNDQMTSQTKIELKYETKIDNSTPIFEIYNTSIYKGSFGIYVDYHTEIHFLSLDLKPEMCEMNPDELYD